jgi:hypothetical protein
MVRQRPACMPACLRTQTGPSRQALPLTSLSFQVAAGSALFKGILLNRNDCG